MSFLSDLIFGIRSVLADNGAAPLRSKVRFIGADCADNPTDDCTDVTITGTGAASSARTITAGPGLSGGGNLTADRTLSVRVRDGLNSALAIFGDGLGVRTNAAKGTAIEGNDLSVACSAVGSVRKLHDGLYVPIDGVTYGWPTAAFTLDGLTANVDLATMLVTAGGIGVNPTKFAPLVGGKTTAANARGLTVRAYDSVTATNNVATTASPVAMLALSVSLAVGEVLDVTGLLASRSGTSNDFADLVISSAAGGAGTVYSTIAANWGNTACALHAQHLATVAGVHHIALRANHAASVFNVAQRRLSYKVWAS